MNRKHSLHVVLFCLLLGTFSGRAQQTVSLKEAVNYALQNKADAVKANLDIRNADAQIAEVKAGALPSINGTGGLTYNPIIQETALTMNDQLMVIKMGQPWSTNIGVNLRQNLFDQSVFIGLKAAKTKIGRAHV